jgi:formylglycine-generating enzyme required for sulfatase activity
MMLFEGRIGRPTMARFASVLSFFLLTLSPALADQRVALVIGIDKYDNLGSHAQLRKAKSDAVAVAGVLRNLGFDVIAKDDVTRSAFNSHWQDFLNKLAPGDMAAFYYAGHGVEFGGRSYLLPRDVPNIRPGRDELLRREALSLQEFLADLREKGTGLNLVILDACRDNPFEQLTGRSVGGRRGLAVAEPPEGTFIMYSAGTGESALDRLNDADRDPNSVYTRHLIPLLRTPGLTLTEVAEQVRVLVRQMAATAQHRQTPAYYNQVLGRVCLAGGHCGSPVAAVPPALLPEVERVWSTVKDSKSIAALEMFRRQYGDANPVYDRLAGARIEELRKQQVALATPPRATPSRCDHVQVGVGTLGEVLCIKPGSGSFRDCWGWNNDDLCGPEMHVVPSGEFVMGSNEYESARPLRGVTISRPFAVGKYEVTFAEWDACFAAGGCKHRPGDEGWGRGKRPVIQVSWHDAKEYTAWLSRKTSRTYRLLSEAEWEYAARAGTTTKYAFGDTIARGQAQFSEGTPWDAERTVEVGSFRANKFGLHDVHGNVQEWVEDGWHSSYEGAPVDGSVWLGGDPTYRVLRGGSWKEMPAFLTLTSAFRYRGDPVRIRNIDVGFRVARTLQ